MKKMIRLITLAATVALIAFPVATSAAPSVAQDQCTQENKDAWYKTFRDTFKTEQQKAYDAAKKYLTACPEETEITAYLKKFVTAYEKADRKGKVAQLFNEKKYTEAFALGKQILTDEPENVQLLVELGHGGYRASTDKNNSFNTEAVGYARKAIQMIASGKTPESWNPFPNREEALAFLNYYVGLQTLPQDASASLSSLIKAAKFESSLKKSPYIYDKIAQAYEAGSYTKQTADYNAKYKDKPETPESKLALENINQVLDRMIDAYARAVASAGADPQFAADKKTWTAALSEYYKFRNKGSDTGLNELVAGILAKPLPPEPTPLTSLPVSAPAATPTSGTGTTNAGNGTNGATATTGTSTNTTSTPTTTTKPATTPAATPTKTTGTKPAGPNRPRKSNHRR